MKVAYCVSGEMRSMDIWDLHKKYFVTPYNADIFLHTWKWNSDGLSDAPFRERNNWTPFVYRNEFAIQTINPSSYIIEDKEKIQADYCTDIQSIKQYTEFVPRDRPFYMWRSWALSFFCCDVIQKYDILIKSRTDIKFNEQLPIVLEEIEDNTVYVPYGNDGAGIPDGMSLCDWFAFGKYDSMKIYFSLYHYVKTYLLNGIPLHPEIMLRHHLQTNNIQIKRFHFNYELYR